VIGFVGVGTLLACDAFEIKAAEEEQAPTSRSRKGRDSGPFCIHLF
jgi:hypothetical protein